MQKFVRFPFIALTYVLQPWIAAQFHSHVHVRIPEVNRAGFNSQHTWAPCAMRSLELKGSKVIELCSLKRSGKIKGTFIDNSIPMGFTEQTRGDYQRYYSNGPQIVHPVCTAKPLWIPEPANRPRKLLRFNILGE